MLHNPKTLTKAADTDLVRDLAQNLATDVVISKRKLKQAEGIELVRARRDEGQQDLAYSSRPFVLCGLPVRRPPKEQLIHTRRNGNFQLEVVAHPRYGLPFGVDRLMPIWLATLAVRQKSQRITFATAGEMLDAFGMQRGGAEYRRLIAGFERVFGATVFFTTEQQRTKARVVDSSRFNFVDHVKIWYSRDPEQRFLPDDFQNEVTLSPEFYAEIMNHKIPADLEAVRALSQAPALLDLYLWLSWRCWTARRQESIPLFGPGGLENQLGVAPYKRQRRFREHLTKWLQTIRALWPECPAVISADGQSLVVDHAEAIRVRRPGDGLLK